MTQLSRPLRLVLVGVLMLLAIVPDAMAQQCPVDQLLAKPAKPQGFPERPLTFFVSGPPGSLSAHISQAMAAAITEVSGVAVVLDFKPGFGGIAAQTALHNAPASDHAVIELDDFAFTASPKPAQELVPITTSQFLSQIYVRLDDARFKDWRSLIDAARMARVPLTIAVVSDVDRENLRSIERFYAIRFRLISQPEAFTALAGGNIDAVISEPTVAEASTIAKPILTLQKQRVPAFPDVPGIAEVGLDFDPLVKFRGFYVKKDIARDRLDWLQWLFRQAQCQPSYRAFNEQTFGKELLGVFGTDASRKFIADTIARMPKITVAVGAPAPGAPQQQQQQQGGGTAAGAPPLPPQAPPLPPQQRQQQQQQQGGGLGLDHPESAASATPPQQQKVIVPAVYNLSFDPIENKDPIVLRSNTKTAVKFSIGPPEADSVLGSMPIDKRLVQLADNKKTPVNVRMVCEICSSNANSIPGHRI